MKHPNPSLAENLHALRERRNLSLDKLSEITGVSKSMLRQIEIGQSNPTIATLWKIANGLRIPFTALLREHTHDVVLQPFRQETPLTGDTDGYRLYPLMQFDPERAFETYYVEMDPGVQHDAEPHQGNAEEHVFVVGGQIEMMINDEHFIIDAQNFIRFQADCFHQYKNNGAEMATAIMTIAYLP